LRQLQNKGADWNWKARLLALASTPYIDFEIAKARQYFATDPDPANLRDCLTLVTSGTKSTKELTKENLLEIHSVLEKNGSGRKGAFRTGPAPSICEGHQPLEAQAVSLAFDRLFEWIASDAFAEMHPIEQMTLCQLRLYEIWPFESQSGLAGDFFALLVLYQGKGLLPLFSPEDSPAFSEALSDAFNFVTKPLVDFNLKGCERACDEALKLI